MVPCLLVEDAPCFAGADGVAPLVAELLLLECVDELELELELEAVFVFPGVIVRAWDPADGGELDGEPAVPPELDFALDFAFAVAPPVFPGVMVRTCPVCPTEEFPVDPDPPEIDLGAAEEPEEPEELGGLEGVIVRTVLLEEPRLVPAPLEVEVGGTLWDVPEALAEPDPERPNAACGEATALGVMVGVLVAEAEVADPEGLPVEICGLDAA